MIFLILPNLVHSQTSNKLDHLTWNDSLKRSDVCWKGERLNLEEHFKLWGFFEYIIVGCLELKAQSSHACTIKELYKKVGLFNVTARCAIPMLCKLAPGLGMCADHISSITTWFCEILSSLTKDFYPFYPREPSFRSLEIITKHN